MWQFECWKSSAVLCMHLLKCAYFFFSLNTHCPRKAFWRYDASVLLNWNWKVVFTLIQKVESRVRILADMRELASAESLDSFTLIYTNILEHQPDCPVILCLTNIFSFANAWLFKNMKQHVNFSLCPTNWHLRFLAWRCREDCGNAGRHSKKGSQGGNVTTPLTSSASLWCCSVFMNLWTFNCGPTEGRFVLIDRLGFFRMLTSNLVVDSYSLVVS